MIIRRLQSKTLRLFILAAVLTTNWYSLSYVLDRYERYRAKKYFAGFEKRLTQTRHDLEKNTAGGTAALETLINDLPYTRNYTRINRVYRQAFRLLTNALIDSGQPERALHWAIRWTEFDPLSVPGRISKGKLLFATQNQKEEGLKLLHTLHLDNPSDPAITDVYLEMLMDRGEIDTAINVIKQYAGGLPRICRTPWRIFWNTGSGFKPQDSAIVLPQMPSSDRMVLKTDLPPGVRFLRVDPPAHLPLLLLAPRMTLITPQEPLILDSYNTRIELYQMKKSADTFCITGGNDPYAIWTLASHEAGKVISVLFMTGISYYFPRESTRVLETASTMKGSNFAADDPDLAGIFEQVRKTTTIYSGCPGF